MWSGGDIYENKYTEYTGFEGEDWHSVWTVTSHPLVFSFLLPMHATDLQVSSYIFLASSTRIIQHIHIKMENPSKFGAFSQLLALKKQ